MLKFVQRFSVLLVALVCWGSVTPVHAERRDNDRGHSDRGNDNRGHENREPDLSDFPKLEVPEGNKVSFHAYAVGVQIYTWSGAAWVFQAPEALLCSTDHRCGIVGIHYAGPTWESNSGSFVVGAVLERATVDPTAIPWLKLAAVDSDGPGIFAGTTFIQRVNTVGGLAPSQPGQTVGQQARVPYTAEYYFYRASHR